MRIDVVSGSRADEGPLRPVVEALHRSGHQSQLSFVCSSGHREDSWQAVRDATSFGLVNVVDPDDLPDLVVLLGDRHEVLGAAVGAYVAGLPIAHLSGGDLTAGSADDAMRHAITKLSHLHFVTNVDSAANVVQMGEDPSRVHVVGCPGIDRIHQLMPSLPRSRDIFLRLTPRPPEHYLLVCYHPDTSGRNDTLFELRAISEAVQRACEDHSMGAVFVGPCMDLGHSEIDAEWGRVHSPQRNLFCWPTLPQEDYLALMRDAVALVGNSSAGFYEAPCLGTHVVNVGSRQKGRIPTNLLMSVGAEDVMAGIHWAMVQHLMPPMTMGHPYGDGRAAERIAKVISSIGDPRQLLQKSFYSGDNPWRQTPGGRRPTQPKTWADTPRSTSSGGSTATSRGERPGVPLTF